MIAFAHTLLNNPLLKIRTCLVVAPLNTVRIQYLFTVKKVLEVNFAHMVSLIISTYVYFCIRC